MLTVRDDDEGAGGDEPKAKGNGAYRNVYATCQPAASPEASGVIARRSLAALRGHCRNSRTVASSAPEPDSKRESDAAVCSLCSCLDRTQKCHLTSYLHANSYFPSHIR